jgi:hypothetical protein
MEAGHLVVVALVEPHALALQQVDGGNNVHGQTRRSCHHGSRLHTHGFRQNRETPPA